MSALRNNCPLPSQLVPGIDDGTLHQVKEQFQSQLGAYGPDTAIGLVLNLTASRISNRLDLKGPAYTVDGACEFDRCGSRSSRTSIWPMRPA